VRLPLEYLAKNPVGRSSKVVVLIDHSQVLPRIVGPGGLQTLLALPQLLQRGDQLAMVTVGRLQMAGGRLGLGLPNAREPPAVNFQPYTKEECEALLAKELSNWATASSVATPESLDIKAVFSSALMKFASQDLGFNLGLLLKVGKEVLRSAALKEVPTGGAAAIMSALQHQIEQVAQRHTGLCDLSGLSEVPCQVASEASATAAMAQMTKAEKRLLLSSYMASRVDPRDDIQLFLPHAIKRKRKRGTGMVARREDEEPAFTRTPRPVPFKRLLAIYHCLARQRQLLGPQIFEKFGVLEEAGLLRFAGDRTASSGQDPKVLCRAELPLARACAADLGVDLAEYLCK